MNVCMHAWCLQRSEDESDALELELPIIVGHHKSAGNQTEVLCKSNKFSLITELTLQLALSFTFILLFYFICMDILPTGTSAPCISLACCPPRPEEDIGFPVNGITMVVSHYICA